MPSRRSIGLSALALATTFLLASCGGGGGDVSGSGGIIGGTGLKGPVAGATVTAYAIVGGAAGTAIATATTDAGGGFSMPVGNYAGPVMLQLAGGTYVDEASGATMAMAAGDVMTAMLLSIKAGAVVSNVHITPLTSMAQTKAQAMSGRMSDANIAAANQAVGSYFMVSDILLVKRPDQSRLIRRFLRRERPNKRAA